MRTIIDGALDKNGNQIYENDIIQIIDNRKLVYLYQKNGQIVCGSLFKYKLKGTESYQISKEYIKKCLVVGYIGVDNNVYLNTDLYEEFKDKKHNLFSYQCNKLS